MVILNSLSRSLDAQYRIYRESEINIKKILDNIKKTK